MKQKHDSTSNNPVCAGFLGKETTKKRFQGSAAYSAPNEFQHQHLLLLHNLMFVLHTFLRLSSLHTDGNTIPTVLFCFVSHAMALVSHFLRLLFDIYMGSNSNVLPWYSFCTKKKITHSTRAMQKKSRFKANAEPWSWFQGSVLSTLWSYFFGHDMFWFVLTASNIKSTWEEV